MYDIISIMNKKYEEEILKTSKFSNGAKTLIYTYEGQKINTIDPSELAILKDRVNAGKGKVQTSIRISEITLWKLELITRYAKYLGIKGYKNNGDVIEGFLSTILPDIDDKTEYEDLDMLDRMSIKKLHYKKDFLFRTFKTDKGHEEVSLVELTYSSNFILRILAINVFAPEILTEFEKNVLFYLSAGSGWIYIKHDQVNNPTKAWLFDLDNPKTIIDYEALYTFFDGKFSERAVQLRLAQQKKSGWTKDIAPKSQKNNELKLKEPQKSEYLRLLKDDAFEAEKYKKYEENKLFNIEKDIDILEFKKRIKEILSLSSKMGKIESEIPQYVLDSLVEDEINLSTLNNTRDRIADEISKLSK